MPLLHGYRLTDKRLSDFPDLPTVKEQGFDVIHVAHGLRDEEARSVGDETAAGRARYHALVEIGGAGEPVEETLAGP